MEQGLDTAPELASAEYIKSMYYSMEQEFETKKQFSDRDWMKKNTNEKS